MDTTNNYPYFGEEMLLTQFSLLAESIQKALPPDSQGQNAIAQQLLRINSKKEKWPSRILSLYGKYMDHGGILSITFPGNHQHSVWGGRVTRSHAFRSKGRRPQLA